MLLQIIQDTESLDSLTHAQGQNPTGMFLIIAVIALTVIILWLIHSRRNFKKSPNESIFSETHQQGQKTQGDKPTTEPNEMKEHEIIQPEKEEQSQPKYIGYNPINIFKQTEPYNFPYVIMPKPGCIIKFPRKGRTGRKGFKEEDFKPYLIQHFYDTFKIFDDRFIIVKGSNKPIEPDFTFTDEKDGINIFLDIEIDEPYEGINDITKRQATHYQYVDTNRNNTFKKRGWIVIRFAEIQVHQNPLSCCLFVADVIKSINPKFEIPAPLLKSQNITPIRQWTKEEAEKWSKEKYREKYLGIDNFGFVQETEKLGIVEETDLGNEIEAEVKDAQPFIPPEDKPIVSSNPNRDLVKAVIDNNRFLSFRYNGCPTITKPKNLIHNTFTAYCFVKNKEREFSVFDIQKPLIKQQPFTIEDTGPNLGLNTIRNIVNTAIQYGKFIRMKYTRSAWTDIETGEITEAEESIRTISNVNFAVNVLSEEHIEQYDLRNEEYEYIHAYCHRREDMRTFRFDRISEIAILDI